jgi:outer membrane lipopolysaccharide assembly protein LptE/RlpB
MANFTIPNKGDYTFTIKVIEADSFLAQDLTNMTIATLELIKLDTLESVATVTGITLDADYALNGRVQFTILNATTSALVYDRGDKVDDYYNKPTYKALVKVAGTDFTDISATIDTVYVTPVQPTLVVV